MNARDLVALIHLAGFTTGIVLYGMLAMMSWRSIRGGGGQEDNRPSGIPVLAAILGLVWNAGALIVFASLDFGLGKPSLWLTAVSLAALGFLPAVVVDSATRGQEHRARPRPIALCAYALSAVGALMQGIAAMEGREASSVSLLMLTIGYLVILLALAITSRRREGGHRALTAVALAAFAVSALHLSQHSTTNDTWVVELIGHHASLPLVLVILYQDYRFALADLFLKRALAVLALVALVVALYGGILAPLLSARPLGQLGIPAVLLITWAATAVAFPFLRRIVDGFVDRVVLKRVDYRQVRADIARDLSASFTVDMALTVACERLSAALSAREVSSSEDAAAHDAAQGTLVTVHAGASATVSIPTSEAPGFVLQIRRLADGRRILSDDVALLDAVALLVGRRVDELRIAEERFERDMREHDMRRLATEAELRALRAQLNPHFLFNALTTIGHLIRTAPPRAVDTLYQLTALLRAVLRGETGDLVPLEQELAIVDAYLAIERARFEERLTVERSVPPELLGARIPPLLVQPLVENAIKHGISPKRAGGTVRIAVDVDEHADGGEPLLRIDVSDTGAGVTSAELSRRREDGVGLSNIGRRLERYFGINGRLTVESTPGEGTRARIWLPLIGVPARVAQSA